MTSPHSENPTSVQTGMTFEERSPSTTWELLTTTTPVPASIWVWFKPEFVPNGLVFRIPDVAWQQTPPIQLTLHQLLQAVEVPVENVLTWHLYGYTYEGMNGTNQQFDQIIPAPTQEIDPAITVSLQAPFSQNDSPAASNSAIIVDEEDLELLEKIDSDWNASLKLEAQLVSLRKQVIGMLSRLNSLNRGLTTEEQLHGDRQDLTEWQDARRWLRDSISKLSRLMKELDIGVTSPAGKRSRFEKIYSQFVIPRQQFEEIEQTQRDFEIHHKALQTLLSRMTVANNNASTDGVNRAQRILSKISAKARQARTKRK